MSSETTAALVFAGVALVMAVVGLLGRIKRCRSCCCDFSLQNGAAPSPIRRWMNSFAREHPSVVQIDLEEATEGDLARRRALSAPVEPTQRSTTTV